MTWKSWGQRMITGEARGLAPDVVRAGFTVASWGYGAGVRAARGLYGAHLRRPVRLARPVVSVGNLTWGGTGKTPVALTLARLLHQQGMRPAILMRGYGGDEALVIRRLAPDLPVFVGTDRVATGRQAIAAGAELLLLDDGFQHWRLHRDLDILLLDARAPFGNGHLLPRGSLREPRSALRRADIVVITKTEAEAPAAASVTATVRVIHPAAQILTARYRPESFEVWPSGPRQPLSSVHGLRTCLLSGIGDPQAFEEMVTGLGVVPAMTRRFVDHHPYSATDLAAIAAACREARVAWIVTTLKDAVRFPTTMSWDGSPRVAVLHARMEITGEGELLQRILSLRRR